MKHLEGKTVYLVPTGNNAPRGNVDPPIREAVINKVARVNVTFTLKGRTDGQKYKISDHDKMHLTSGYNCGYKIYESLDAIEEEREVRRIAIKIHDSFPYVHNYERLTLATTKKVAELLGVEK